VVKTARSKRYAQAVFQIARHDGATDKWLVDLKALSELQHSDIFVKALETPNLSFADKARLLADRYPALNPLAVNLVNLLIEQRRVGLLPGIFQEYGRLLDRDRGIQRANVVTAVALTEEDRLHLEERLSGITGKKTVVTAIVDPAVVGGMVARFEGRLLDGSTRSRLDALKQEIAHTPR
jgi:F-type H+-transporting ATPase subunit delta